MKVGPIPIIRLYESLIVPIQGMVSDTAMAALCRDVTRRIETEGARGLVIDVSSVHVMDSFLTRSLRDLALTARLMGVNTVLSGMHPEVAMTLVDMGMDIPGIRTTLNLERALDYLSAHEKEESSFGGESVKADG